MTFILLYIEFTLIVGFGFGVGFTYFDMVLLPLFYSLPKSLFNIIRGKMKWRILGITLISPREKTGLRWVSTMLFVIIISYKFFPSVFQYLRQNEPFYWGLTIGFIIRSIQPMGIRYLFTKEGRKSIRSDYEGFSYKYRL